MAAAEGTLREAREQTWLPLLLALTQDQPRWLVYKGADSAFHGTGDVDTVAPREDWDAITSIFTGWAIDQHLGAVVRCDHVPNVLHLVALDPHSPFFFEMDVNCRKIFLGSTLFRPPDLLPHTCTDPRGFRHLRPGIEGLVKLVQNGAHRGGRPNWEGVRAKGITELLASDPEGVALGSHLFGRGARSVNRLADAVVRGEWDRAAMMKVEAHCVARSVREPDAVAMRLRFRRVRAACPLLRAVFSGRSTPDDREAWLTEVGREHVVRHPHAEPPTAM